MNPPLNIDYIWIHYQYKYKHYKYPNQDTISIITIIIFSCNLEALETITVVFSTSVEPWQPTYLCSLECLYTEGNRNEKIHSQISDGFMRQQANAWCILYYEWRLMASMCLTKCVCVRVRLSVCDCVCLCVCVCLRACTRACLPVCVGLYVRACVRVLLDGVSFFLSTLYQHKWLSAKHFYCMCHCIMQREILSANRG